jgi:DnaD/phage-associated family protein
MNIKINYGTGVATLPTSAYDFLDRATKADIKVLFLLCAEPALLYGESREDSLRKICERTGYSASQIESSLAFWRGTGVLDSEEPQQVTVAPVETEPTVSTAEASPDTPNTTATVTVTRSKSRPLDEIPNYTGDDLENFFEEYNEAASYLKEYQDTWGSIFSPRDNNLIIALIREWGLSWDYVDALLASAAKYFAARENQGKSLNYVYRTAVNYHKEGITTLEALQQKFVEQDKMVDFEQRIRTMFGMGARHLTPKEKKYFSTWLYEYKYDIEIVEYAYNIAVDTKGVPNINYINGILKNWYEDGLTTLDAIIAKKAQDTATIRSVKEGKLTPDNAPEIVRSALESNSVTNHQNTVAVNHISQDVNIIRRLFNLGNRLLTEGEISSFGTWRSDYGFRYEIIYYAYQITLENLGDYSLPYIDAILKKWHEKNFDTVEQIKLYEQGYKEDKNRKKTPAHSPEKGGSFETSDFFAAAVKRSLGDDFDPDILKQ